MYLLLTQLVNFTGATLPPSRREDRYPWGSEIRSLSTLAPSYSADPFANRIWVLSAELSTTYTSISTTVSNSTTDTITTTITTLAPGASNFIAPQAAASQITDLGLSPGDGPGAYSMQPQIITYMTTEEVKTTSTIATKGADAIVLVGDVVPQQQTVLMVTQTFGLGVRETEIGTMTVRKASGGAKVVLGVWGGMAAAGVLVLGAAM